MDFKQSQHKAGTNKDQLAMSLNNSKWLVSFGDLLTLLLCFFLTIVSFSAFSSKENSSSEELSDRNSANYSESIENTTEIAAAGTLIAPLESEFLDLKVQFVESDFGTKPNKLSPVAIERLRNEVKRDGYVIDEILLSACFAQQIMGKTHSWYYSTGRAFELRSQLIDAGIDTKGIHLRVLGPGCESLSQTQKEQIVSQIELKMRRVLNG